MHINVFVAPTKGSVLVIWHWMVKLGLLCWSQEATNIYQVQIGKNFGPRNMGAGPSGIAAMNIHTGEIKYVVSVPFQISHIKQIRGLQVVFCWETGGKSQEPGP